MISMNPAAMESLPTLDLYNFTEAIATESQYILTSPRSLEACARFGIKPVELLPKTKEEFESDYASFSENPGVLYKKFEKERLRKLRLCRQERERIIDENAREDSDDDDSDLPYEGDFHPSAEESEPFCELDLTGDSNYDCKGYNGDLTMSNTVEKPTIIDYINSNYHHDSSRRTDMLTPTGSLDELNGITDSPINSPPKWSDKFKTCENFETEVDLNSVKKSKRQQRRKVHKSPTASPRSFCTKTFGSQARQQQSANRMFQMQEITEKHMRAGETFQEQMRQKIQKREYNRLKQQERKEFQERQLQKMEKDLKLWQQELKAYQDICLNRASKVVEKRNAMTSAKTHEKRYQKEVEHAMMKSKVDEEERRRQEELKHLVNIKDTRSKMIITAKEEYANAGREYVNIPSNFKNSYKNMCNSFDKMALEGERMARLEQMNSAKKATQKSHLLLI